MIKIDRHKVYESHGYHFINFIDLTLDQKKMILEWRNHENVRKMMVHKEPINLVDHLKFIDELEERDDCYYWMVKDPTGAEVGVLDLIHVDYAKDEGEIGYYINPEATGKGFEFMIECNYFVYFQLQLGNNIVTINVKNKDVLIFNKYLGASFEYKEQIGTDSFYINKHAKGDYIINHYAEFNLLDYARFVKKNKNNITFNL